MYIALECIIVSEVSSLLGSCDQSRTERWNGRVAAGGARRHWNYRKYDADKGTAVAQWLMCCATNRKVAGSIPDGISGFFIDINPYDRTMALGSTHSLTNEYQEDYLA